MIQKKQQQQKIGNYLSSDWLLFVFISESENSSGTTLNGDIHNLEAIKTMQYINLKNL